MSHFTVLVIGENPEKQLEPFEENLQVEWVETSEEHKNDYENKIVQEFYCSSSSSWGQEITKELFDFIKNNEIGAVSHYRVEKKGGFGYFKNNHKYCGHYVESNGKRCEDDAWFEVIRIDITTHPNPDVCFEGTISIRSIEAPKEIPLKEKYPDYNTYLKNWCGIDEGKKEGYWRNPKAKWDWYELGGRWTGFFKLKPGTNGEVGEPGLMTSKAKEGYVDQALKKDIDFDGMRNNAIKKAEEAYDKAMSYVGHISEHENWNSLRNKMEAEGKTMDDIREIYHQQPRCIAWKEIKDTDFRYGYEVDNFSVTKEEYVENAKNSAVSTFALVKDGEWFEKGKMGWWGITHNEMERSKWNEKINELLNSLPEDTILSIYDCHI